MLIATALLFQYLKQQTFQGEHISEQFADAK